MQVNGPDGNEQERRRLFQRVIQCETLLKEARYVLDEDRRCGNLWAGSISERITALLNESADLGHEALIAHNAER